MSVAPLVLRIMEFAPIVWNESAKLTFLVAAKVRVSVPQKVITLSAKMVVPETVRVLPAAMFRVFVPFGVIVRPLIVPEFVKLPALSNLNLVQPLALAVNRSPTPSLLATSAAKLV